MAGLSESIYFKDHIENERKFPIEKESLETKKKKCIPKWSVACQNAASIMHLGAFTSSFHIYCKQLIENANECHEQRWICYGIIPILFFCSNEGKANSFFS